MPIAITILSKWDYFKTKIINEIEDVISSKKAISRSSELICFLKDTQMIGSSFALKKSTQRDKEEA